MRVLLLAYRQADSEQRDYVVVPQPRKGMDQEPPIPYCVPLSDADGYDREFGIIVDWRFVEDHSVRDTLTGVMGCLHRAGKSPENPEPALREALHLIVDELDRRNNAAD